MKLGSAPSYSNETRREILKVFLIIVIIFFSGCNYLRNFPLYSELHVRQYESKQLFNEKEWIDNPYYKGSKRYLDVSKLKNRVKSYLDTYPETPSLQAEAMRELTLLKGMNEDQVIALAGKPTNINKKKFNEEIWTYRRWRSDPFVWYYSWGHLKFKDKILTIIEPLEIEMDAL